MTVANLYESKALREFTGPVIRPGGFGLTERGLAHCRLGPGVRVLDVGCGTGAVVDYMRQRHGLAAMGIDYSAVLLEEGSRTCGGSPLVRARAELLPASDAIFGAVLCECVLSLCPAPLSVLRETRRVLHSGGYLILTDVYSRGPDTTPRIGVTSVQCCLQGAVDRATVADRIAAADYEMLLWEDHTPLLKNLAAQLVWTYGSLDAFWSVVGGPAATATISRGGSGGCNRPGYYLLVARKP